jgi:glycosyltransferase 2 family protein
VKLFMLGAVLLGAALLGFVVAQTNLDEVWRHLHALGVGGIALMFLLYLVAFLFEVLSWQLTLVSVPITPRWVYRLFNILMFGSAFEKVTPFAGLGGEPIKAVALKRHFGVPYREGTASLVLTRMSDVVALILFVTMGLCLILSEDVLSVPFQIGAIAGLTLLVANTIGFFVVQRYRVFSRLHAWLDRRFGERIGARVGAVLDGIHDVEDHLVNFYTARPGRFVASISAAFFQWMMGAAAAYAALDLLGHPVSFADAIVIEAVTLLVISTLFFVPGDLGTQEVAMVTIVEGLTGSSGLGLALAAIRRAHDLLWIAWGLAIGGKYSVTGAEVEQPARSFAIVGAEAEAAGDPLRDYSAPPGTDSIAPREDRAR